MLQITECGWKSGLAVRRCAWLALGWIALSMGIIGAALPVLPTTPFVILAAFAFGRSSPQLQVWLGNSRLFGSIIADWGRGGAIAPRYKLIAMAMMMAAFSASVAMGFGVLVLIVQGICMMGAIIFILSRPSYAAAAPKKWCEIYLGQQKRLRNATADPCYFHFIAPAVTYSRTILAEQQHYPPLAGDLRCCQPETCGSRPRRINDCRFARPEDR